MTQLGQRHAGLPDGLVNFRYDPVACAVALGWPGAAVEETRLRLVRRAELARFKPGPAGRPVRMLTSLARPASPNTGSPRSGSQSPA
jgi:hypothetical protein